LQTIRCLAFNCQAQFGFVLRDTINNNRFYRGVFTSNIHRAEYAFENSEVGGVVVNDVPSLRVDRFFFMFCCVCHRLLTYIC
jgi:hypothetical protein